MKNFAVVNVVINDAVDAEVDKVVIVSSLEEGKAKVDEMIKEFVAEHYDEDEEIEETVDYYKSDECEYKETDLNNGWQCSFIDEPSNNPSMVMYRVIEIG